MWAWGVVGWVGGATNHAAVTITFEGSWWELLGKAVCALAVLAVVLSALYLLVLMWGMGGWRPWNFIIEWRDERRREKDRAKVKEQ